MKRTPLKRGSSLLKRSHFKKKAKGEEITEKDKGKYKMMAFFELFWLSLPEGARVCRSCEKPLYEPIRSYYFDHLIEKSKRPDLAYKPENIFLCCLTCHSLKTDGHPTEKHKDAIEKAKERFGIS
jgi:5-methylcytosine-specific restriction endonuclease McrA